MTEMRAKLHEAFDFRHSAVVDKLVFLEPNRNLTGTAAEIAELFRDTALSLITLVEHDNANLTLALEHLIDAKDSAIRAYLLEVLR